MGKLYTEMLSDVKGIRLPVAETDYARNIYWVYGILLDEDIRVTNREITKLLAAEGVGTRTFFWCMHKQPVFQKNEMFSGEKHETAEYLARKGFYIPSGLAITKEQMEIVTEKVKKVLSEVL